VFDLRDPADSALKASFGLPYWETTARRAACQHPAARAFGSSPSNEPCSKTQRRSSWKSGNYGVYDVGRPGQYLLGRSSAKEEVSSVSTNGQCDGDLNITDVQGQGPIVAPPRSCKAVPIIPFVGATFRDTLLQVTVSY
jgi:hypothetical protein